MKRLVKYVFAPSLLLWILLLISYSFFSAYFNQWHESVFRGAQSLVYVRGKIPPAIGTIAFTISLSIFAINKPFEKVCRLTLFLLTVLSTLTLGLLLFYTYFEYNENFKIFTTYKTLIKCVILFLSSILKFGIYSIGSLFVWAFINRLLSLSEGLRYYIGFALLYSFPILGMPALQDLALSRWPPISLAICCVVFLTSSLITFNAAWKRLPTDLLRPKEQTPSTFKFPWLSNAWLLIGPQMIGSYLYTFFKAQLHIKFPAKNALVNAIGDFSLYSGYARIVFSMILPLLGSWLIFKKGWKSAAFCSGLSVALVGTIFVTTPLPPFLASLYISLIKSIGAVLLFPLAQIIFLHLPFQKRFKAQFFTQIILWAFIELLLGFISQGLIIFPGMSIPSIFMVMNMFFVVLLLLSIYRVGFKVSKVKAIFNSRAS